MYLGYIDESGDDGFPNYSSPIFVLSVVYIYYQKWQESYRKIFEFREHLHLIYGLPKKQEIHTKEFILNKKPFEKLGINDVNRVNIFEEYCTFLSNLDIKVINVAINKLAIKKAKYDVLDTSFSYLIQRIENTLHHLDSQSKFLLITDPGRVGKMRSTSRRIQRINYIPVKGLPGTSYRKEINQLIEDPLPKDSDQSFFIQIADLFAFLSYHYVRNKYAISPLPNRMLRIINDQKIFNWLNLLKPVLNLKASSSDPYGIVCYPK
ncbi:MAG: DUF3800 domain-containing protein [Anaerolineae bacterium]|nr:DUF3800 domain-containing protein [Anaerolineae bacterium]